MKRAGDLYDGLAERENLRVAFWKAARGCRASPACIRFAARLDENLARLAEEIRDGSVEPGGFHRFRIYDPKERVISAPPFRDRVLHHAIMNVCEPHLDRWLIADTFACRTGKGRLRALDRASHFARRHPWFLKMDIRKYFDSVSHDRLLALFGRRFKDRRLLALLGKLVHSHESAPARGLPIGSLISQHLANFYLGWLDRYVKETLRRPGYVRYMDDFVVWGDGWDDLAAVLDSVRGFLSSELDLTLKDFPYANRTGHGMDFLGFRVFPKRREPNRASRRRFSRRTLALGAAWERGEVTALQLQQRTAAMIAFVREGDACHLLRRVAAMAPTA